MTRKIYIHVALSDYGYPLAKETLHFCKQAQAKPSINNKKKHNEKVNRTINIQKKGKKK